MHSCASLEVINDELDSILYGMSYISRKHYTAPSGGDVLLPFAECLLSKVSFCWKFNTMLKFLPNSCLTMIYDRFVNLSPL